MFILQDAFELYKKGLTVIDLADIYECTHQNVTYNFRRNYPEEYKKAKLNNREKKKEKTIEKHKKSCNQCGKEFASYSTSFCSRNCAYDFKTIYYRRKSGESDREYNTNRARVYYKKNLKFREQIKKNNKNSYRRHRTKAKARANLNYHVQQGNIIKPESCTKCGKKPPEVRRIEAHHEDYSKPLDVVWLCTPCHHQADLKLKLRGL